MENASYEHQGITFAAPGKGVAWNAPWPPEGKEKQQLNHMADRLARMVASLNAEYPNLRLSVNVGFDPSKGRIAAVGGVNTILIAPDQLIGNNPLPPDVMESMLWHELGHIFNKDSFTQRGIEALYKSTKDLFYCDELKRKDPALFAEKVVELFGTEAAYHTVGRQIDQAMRRVLPLLHAYEKNPSDNAMVKRLYEDAALQKELRDIFRLAVVDKRLGSLKEFSPDIQYLNMVPEIAADDEGLLLHAIKRSMDVQPHEQKLLLHWMKSLTRAMEFRADDFVVMHAENPTDYAKHLQVRVEHIGQGNAPHRRPEDTKLFASTGIDRRTHPWTPERIQRSEALAAQLTKQGLLGPRTREHALRVVNRDMERSAVRG